MFKKILLVLLIAVVALVVVIATRPATYQVSRSTAVAAPPDVVFPQLNDFHNWVEWSPWDKMDPKMTKTFSGPASGKDSVYHWVGNDKAGEGEMKILDSTPNEKVTIKLDFIKPFPSTATTTFSVAPDGPGSKVTWAMSGNHDFMGKAFTMFMNMDKMIGADFDKGLATMKGIAEADAKKRADAKAAADKAAAEAKAAEEAKAAADAKAAEEAKAAEDAKKKKKKK